MSFTHNTPLPAVIIEDVRLSLLERALLPLVALHSLQYGEVLPGIEANRMAALLHIDVKEILMALEALKIKGYVQEHILIQDKKRIHFWQVGLNYIAALNGNFKPQQDKKRSILDLDLTAITELESEALIKLHTLGLSKDIWDSWYATARADDIESENFMHLFMEHINSVLKQMKRPASQSLTIHDSTRPNPQQFELAQYFHTRWKELYAQHQEPHNMMLEAVNLKTIEEIKGIPLQTIQKAMEWLFSDAGKWYRSNIKNCILFRKKFDYILRQAMSASSDKSPTLPVGANIFDMIEDEF